MRTLMMVVGAILWVLPLVYIAKNWPGWELYFGIVVPLTGAILFAAGMVRRSDVRS